MHDIGTNYKTVDELVVADLPRGSLVLGGNGTAWQRRESGDYAPATFRAPSEGITDAQRPFTLVYIAPPGW